MKHLLHHLPLGKRPFSRIIVAAAVSLAVPWLFGCGGSSNDNSAASSGSDSTSTSTTKGATDASPVAPESDHVSVPGASNPSSISIRRTTKPAVGRVAPPFTLPQVGGGKLSLASLKGKVVLLDFWATWCIPCMAELPDFEQLYTKYGSQGLVVVGMTGVTGFPSTPAQVAATKQSKHLTFPLVTTDGATETAYHTGSQIPASVLIDRQGHVVEEVHAAPSPSALQFWSPLIEKALKG